MIKTEALQGNVIFNWEKISMFGQVENMREGVAGEGTQDLLNEVEWCGLNSGGIKEKR